MPASVVYRFPDELKQTGFVPLNEGTGNGFMVTGNTVGAAEAHPLLLE
jgi:hypothetical protein